MLYFVLRLRIYIKFHKPFKFPTWKNGAINTPGVDFINFLGANFSYKVFGAAFLQLCFGVDEIDPQGRFHEHVCEAFLR